MTKAEVVSQIRTARDHALANDWEAAHAALVRAQVEVEQRLAQEQDREAARALVAGRKRCGRCGHLLRLTDGKCWFCSKGGK